MSAASFPRVSHKRVHSLECPMQAVRVEREFLLILAGFLAGSAPLLLRLRFPDALALCSCVSLPLASSNCKVRIFLSRVPPLPTPQ